MEVEIVKFPETKVAVVEHVGSPAREHESVNKLVNWRIENGVPPSSTHRNYGVHYNDPDSVPPEEYRVDLCISVDEDIADNPYDVINKVIPELRCSPYIWRNA